MTNYNNRMDLTEGNGFFYKTSIPKSNVVLLLQE